MKTSILSLFATFFCLTFANAQFNSFDLSKYKTADYTRRMLTFSGNISGDYRENKKDDGYHDYSKNFLSNLQLEYSSNKNTRKSQQETYINFRLKPNDYGFSSESQSTSTFYNYSNSRDNRNNSGINFNSANRLYFKPNMFVEINPSGDLDANFNKHETKQTSNGNTIEDSESKRSLDGNFTLPVRLGVGRLENVEDARMAIFILEDLQKNNQLAKSISDEEILAFATKITQLRNKRHFDSRKRRIYEIQALDSFIRNNGYSGSQDAVYFSSLIDNWGYAYNPGRMAGNRFSIGVGPTIGYSVQNILSNEKNSDFYRGYNISFLANFEKPLSLKWQRSIQLQTGYLKSYQRSTFENSKSSETENNFNTDQIYMGLNWGYGFYPDSRSYHSVSFNPTIQKIWIDHENGITTTDLAGNISLWLNGFIYLSERFNINYAFNVRYQESKSDYTTETIKKNNFATSFNLSCSYSIF